MNTINGQCTRVPDDKNQNTHKPQTKKSQREIVDDNIRPWLPVFMILMAFLGITKMMLDSHWESRDSDQVKLARQATAQEMYKAEVAKAEAEKAKNTLSNARIIIPSPFPTRGE